MTEAPLVAVEVPMVGDERRKHWAKIVHSVDTSKASGWAFVGDFIAAGGIQDVPAGSVVLVYGERGSRTNPQIEARVYTANPDATLTPHLAARGRAWARTIRDTVEDLLGADLPTRSEWRPELLAFSDDALAEEMRRRGWELTPPQP
ncbi:MAG: hypothetical protein OEM66_01855 [Acidimicrobiia bacterium]|nr:hypothetical protein [Acidimicrobiia bacterium]